MNNLSDMKKDNAFKVPENYFENLSERVQDKIEKEEQIQDRKFIDLVKPYIWMAASVVALALIGKLILTTTIPSEYKIQQVSQIEDTNSNSISTNENNLTFDNMTDVSTDEIIDYLSDYDIETDELLANL